MTDASGGRRRAGGRSQRVRPGARVGESASGTPPRARHAGEPLTPVDREVASLFGAIVSFLVSANRLGPADAERLSSVGARLATLAACVTAHGALRVRGLSVVDAADHEVITLGTGDGWAEVAVRLPRPEGTDSTAVALYATQGPADLSGIEPSVGMDMSVAGNQAMVLEVISDRRGGWTVTRSMPEPPAGV